MAAGIDVTGIDQTARMKITELEAKIAKLEKEVLLLLQEREARNKRFDCV